MKIYVPATTTNFGSGFDTFGLALELFNVFEVKKSNSFKVEIKGEGKNLPKNENNLVIKVYKKTCETCGVYPQPFEIYQFNRIPTSRGLGSSATAIVGGIEIACRLHNLKLSLKDKLKIASLFESHFDNLIPAFVGGFVICIQNKDIYFERIKFPEDIRLVFVVPDFELSTESARGVLKKSVSLQDAVFNIQRASLMVYSLLRGNYPLLREAVKDKLHQPLRANLIPGFYKVLEAGYSAGAYAVFLSGAGPTIGALVSPEFSDKVGKAMNKAFSSEGISSRIFKLKASEKGAFSE